MHVLGGTLLILLAVKLIDLAQRSFCDLKSDFKENIKLKKQLNQTIENHSEQIKYFGGISKIKIEAVKKLILN